MKKSKQHQGVSLSHAVHRYNTLLVNVIVSEMMSLLLLFFLFIYTLYPEDHARFVENEFLKVGWLVVLRINVDLAIFQSYMYLDLEAEDNQSLKIQVARPGIEP